MILLGAYSFILGLVIGSFLNVCIWRLPRRESIVLPRSHCPECDTQLGPGDLIPVISYLLLRGRCRYCRAAISWRYPLVELITGLLFLWSFSVFKIQLVELLSSMAFISFLIVISFIDLEKRLIPNNLTVPGTILGFLLSLIPRGITPYDSALGMLVGLIVVFLIIAFSRGGMGMGDAKLLAMIGAWTGLTGALGALFIGALLGSIVGGVLLLLKVIDRRSPIPFGPFLSVGGIAMLFYGEILISIIFPYLSA